MSHPVHEAHRKAGPRVARCLVITVSDTRSLADDKSGALMIERLSGAGHEITERKIIKDEAADIHAALCAARDSGPGGPQLALLSGGTGLTHRDSTFEVVSALIDRPIPGFGELFRMLSYQEIGSAAMLSRACAGLIGPLLVFALPGSSAGVRLALDSLILPEIPHFLEQLGR
jgi:molybdenum cofactor biosynthesis protein B